MKKVSLSINLLELQGACSASIKGEDCVIIRLGKSRAKAHQNGKVYLSLEAIERNNGADDYGNTHFICEPSTKDERESGVKLPIIGNGKAFDSDSKKAAPARQQQKLPARQTPQQHAEESMNDGMDTSDIPF
jgi:hypothetical protein